MRIYFDVTDTVYTKNNTGIQRVVKKTLLNMSTAAEQIQVIPVISFNGAFHEISLSIDEIVALRKEMNSSVEQKLRTRVKSFLRLKLANFPLFETVLRSWYRKRRIDKELKPIVRSKVNPSRQDILYLSDYLFGQVDILKAVENYKNKSENIIALFYDLIPITHPQFFYSDDFVRKFKSQLPKFAALARKLITISQTSKNKFRRIFSDLETPIAVHLLAVEFPAANLGPSHLVDERKEPLFLTVGTVEPRKGHITILEAMEKIWRSGKRYELLIVGKDGWDNDLIKKKLHELQAEGFPVRWIRDADDKCLANAYASSTAVICASQAEGYGLPLIEAQHFGKHVIASNIEIFKELNSPNITYFNEGNAQDLFKTLNQFTAPEFTPVCIPTWAEYSRDILSTLKS